MLKQLLIITFVALALLICFSVKAQFKYTFKDTVGTYVPLSGASSLNGAVIWDGETFVAPIPFPWIIDSNLLTHNCLLILDGLPGCYADTTKYWDINGFTLGDIDIADRGLLTGTISKSPIRYLTTGSSPNRIFKLEFWNGGFYDEYDKLATMNDSFNLQIWVYETTNIVELHYGSSLVTHESIYYHFHSGGLLSGYVKHLNESSGSPSLGSYYFLKGNPNSPLLDTFILPNIPSGGLSFWPPNGTVYRYTPTWKACIPPVPNFLQSIPTGKTVGFTYSGTLALDSVRWNFGDGGSSNALNPSHTFPTNGHYNVCVTAFNLCGALTSCHVLPLAIQKVDALQHINISPNPASNSITLEGLQIGAKARIQNLTGQTVQQFDVLISRQEMNISALPPGTYILLLSNPDGVKECRTITKK